MLVRNIQLTVSCALGASAFLLPPGATPATKNSLLPLSELDTKTHILSLPCTSCSLDAEKTASKDDDLFWIQDTRRPSGVNLLLNFTISDDGKALLLNNEQVFPVSYDIKDLLKPEWFIEQISAATEQEDILKGEVEGTPARITGHMLGQAGTVPASPNGDELLSLSWQLLSLDHQAADVDEVLIQMIRTSDGELMLLAVDRTPDSIMADILFPTPALKPVEIVPFVEVKPHGRPHGRPDDHPHDGPHGRPHGRPHANCKNLPGPLCSIVDFVDNKINSLKFGRPGCAGKPKFDSFDGRLPTHVRPHFGQHGKDGKFGPPKPHHHHRHGIFHRVSKTILAVLIPAMAGIIVGMVVSVLGLLTGHFIGWLWFTVIRGGRKGAYSRVAANDIAIVVTDADKKQDSVEEEQTEHLPRYEDAPAYEEAEKEAV